MIARMKTLRGTVQWSMIRAKMRSPTFRALAAGAAILLAATLPVPAQEAGAELSGEAGSEPFISGVTPSGYVTGSLWATPKAEDPLSTAGFRGALALSGYAGDNADFKLSLEYALNGAGLSDAGDLEAEWYAPAAFGAALADRARLDLALKEAWVSFYAGDFDFIIGQQVVTWGQADGTNPTDNANARYVGTRDASTTDEKKIASPMVNALWNLPSGKGTIQGLFMPLSVANRMPDMGDFIKEEMAAFSPGNFEGGLRGLFYLGQASVSASWLTILDRYPSDVTDWKSVQVSAFPPPGIYVDMPASIGHTRRQVFGFDAAIFAGPYDLRAEATYTLTEDATGDDPYKKNPSLTGVAQGSRSFMDGRLSLALSWAPTWIQAFEKVDDEDLASPAVQLFVGQGFEFEQMVALRAQGKLFGETLQPEAMFMAALAARDWLGTVAVAYNLADGWNLKAGANLHGSFRPDDDPLRQLGVFGNDAALDSDSVYLELRFDF